METIEKFELLRDDWDIVLEYAADTSVFMSWEWQYNWWRYYGRENRLCILTAWENERLIGILPLYIQQVVVYRICPVNVLRFIGTGGDTSPDYLGPVLQPISAKPTALAFVDFLLKELGGWDIFHLSDLCHDSIFFKTLTKQRTTPDFHLTTSVAANIAFITLPTSWDDYLASVHRDRRYTIRSTRRKFESHFGGRFYVKSEEEGIDEVIDYLMRLHHQRWQTKGERHAFSSPEYVGFHRDVIHACARRGWIRFYCLEANALPIAIFYCYRFRNRIYYFQAGFDPDYERLRPGLVLIGFAVECAIQEGNKIFDFLRGEHEYKTQWGKSMHETHTLNGYRRGLRSEVYRFRELRIPALKRWLKSLFSFLRRDRHNYSGGHFDKKGQ